jgi:hypothetical protein
MARWEAEVKKSLASKKAAASATFSLTKQEQALVQAQLEEEANVRQRVDGVKANLQRGLHFVRSLVMADVDEFRFYVSSVASLLLEGALSSNGSTLIWRDGFETYLVSASLAESLHIIIPRCRSSLNAVQSDWIPTENGSA